MKKLSKNQQIQEEEYLFPYHYLDIHLDSHKDLFYLGRNALLTEVIKVLNPKKGELILDACCGDGRFCYELGDSDAKIIGIDYSERAIKFAKIFNDSKDFFCGDLKKFKYNKKFDKIVLIESLEHFPAQEIPLFLENIKNLLKKDGKLIVTVPSDKLPLQEKHYQHFTSKKLNGILQNYFEVEKISGYSCLGGKRKIYNFFEKLGRILLPLKNKPLFKKYYPHLRNYYFKNLSIGGKDNSLGLIAVCKNKL